MMDIISEVATIKKDKALSASDKLDRIAQLYGKHNYIVISRTENQLQMSRKKTFSFFWALLWFLVFGVGLLVYIFYYLSKKDEIITITLPQSKNTNVASEKISNETAVQINELDYLKNKIGSREKYHNIIKYHTFDKPDQDTLLQASVNVRKENPDQGLIKKAYKILSEKESEVLSLPTKKSQEKKVTVNEVNSEENMSFSIADEILKLKSLKDDGIISEEEFTIQKDKLLNR